MDYATADATRKENPVSTARNRVSLVVDEMDKLVDQANEIANVQFGPRPEPASTNAVAARETRRDGESGLLHEQIDRLEYRVDQMAKALSRLSAFGVVDAPHDEAEMIRPMRAVR